MRADGRPDPPLRPGRSTSTCTSPTASTTSYDITFGFEGWDGRYGRSPRDRRWLDERLHARRWTAALKASGPHPGAADLRAVDDAAPEQGLDIGAVARRASPPATAT